MMPRFPSVNRIPTTMTMRPRTTCAVTRGRALEGVTSMSALDSLSGPRAARARQLLQHEHDPRRDDDERPRGAVRQPEEMEVGHDHPAGQHDEPEARQRAPPRV